MLIHWGIDKADVLGLEAFVESTDDGKPCYKENGFTYRNTVYMHAAK